MSRSDYARPADYQINKIYRCGTCRRETEHPSIYAPPECCGSEMTECGESYPASADEWDEVRDTQDGEWHNRGRY